ATFTGFLESEWFPKVLQGQEICSFKSLTGKRDYYSNQTGATTGFYPLASVGARNIAIQQKGVYEMARGHLVPSNFFNLHHQRNHHHHHLSASNSSSSQTKTRSPDRLDPPAKNAIYDGNPEEKATSFKIFGFLLTEDDPAA
ncbi:hypothetical protein M569_08057, partial [Genlisea aurea]